jgi:hypothetical protein
MSDKDLKKSFDDSRLATAASRIGHVVQQNNYTVITDVNHKKIAPYELAANKQTMAAIAGSGAKHIMIETLTSENPMYEAYMRGEISDRTLEYGMTIMGPSSLVEVYTGKKNPPEEKAYVDLVKNAKEAGIKIHGINGSEGAQGESRSSLDKRLESLGAMKLIALKNIESNPAFFDMDRTEQGEFIARAVYEKIDDPDRVADGLNYMVYGYGKNAEQINSLSVGAARLQDDPDVAERIGSFANGEKTVIIYGETHFLRFSGDIDANLAGCSVIDVHTDTGSYNSIEKPRINALSAYMGIPFNDAGDYTLDLQKGLWTDNTTGESAKVSVPEMTSVPPATSTPDALPGRKPSTMTPANP